MATVKLSDALVAKAKIKSKIFNRSVAGQIEYWAKIGKILEANSGLHYEFVRDILIAKAELENGQFEPFEFLKD